MNERIHQALDGDIDPTRLTSGERLALRQAESDIDAAVAAIPVRPLPDLAPAILARLGGPALPRRKAVVVPAEGAASLLQRLWKPRQITFGWRPAYALAASILVAILITGQALRPARVTAVTEPKVFTRFVLSIPDAKAVSLAGDFTDWQPTYAMTQAGPELWTIVVPLEPGVHTYAFLIDGQRWIADPTAPNVNDGFGGNNSRVSVLAPDLRGS